MTQAAHAYSAGLQPPCHHPDTFNPQYCTCKRLRASCQLALPLHCYVAVAHHQPWRAMLFDIGLSAITCTRPHLGEDEDLVAFFAQQGQHPVQQGHLAALLHHVVRRGEHDAVVEGRGDQVCTWTNPSEIASSGMPAWSGQADGLPACFMASCCGTLCLRAGPGYGQLLQQSVAGSARCL